jgi:hypothetical protein
MMGITELPDSTFSKIKHIGPRQDRNPWADEPDWEERRKEWFGGKKRRWATREERLNWMAATSAFRCEDWHTEECYNCPDYWCPAHCRKRTSSTE